MPEEPSTDVSDIADDLARLSMPTSVPSLRGAIEWNDLTPAEAWIVSVVSAGFTVRAIVEVSPLSEEDTLTLLARLIDARILAMK